MHCSLRNFQVRDCLPWAFSGLKVPPDYRKNCSNPNCKKDEPHDTVWSCGCHFHSECINGPDPCQCGEVRVTAHTNALRKAIDSILVNSETEFEEEDEQSFDEESPEAMDQACASFTLDELDQRIQGGLERLREAKPASRPDPVLAAPFEDAEIKKRRHIFLGTLKESHKLPEAKLKLVTEAQGAYPKLLLTEESQGSYMVWMAPVRQANQFKRVPKTRGGPVFLSRNHFDTKDEFQHTEEHPARGIYLSSRDWKLFTSH